MNTKPVLIALEPNPELRHEFNALRDQFAVHIAATPPLACVDLINTGGSVLVVDSGDNPGRAALQVQFFREYIANLAKPDISILVIVNCPLLAIEKLALRCGADAVLARPFTSDQLLKVVRNMIKNSEDDDASQDPERCEEAAVLDAVSAENPMSQRAMAHSGRVAFMGAF